MKLLRLIPCLALVLSSIQCEKKETPAARAASSAPAAAAAVVTPPKGLVAHAGKLGFASRLPAETEFYFGSVNFKAHLEGLKKSAFYKEVSALANDKTPAPAAGDKTMKALQQLWGDEVFVAGAAGMTEFSTWLRQFSRLYNELNFRMLMTGSVANATAPKSGGTASGFNPAVLLESLLADPSQLDRASAIVAGFEMPPLIIGFKVEKAADVVRDLIPEDFLKNAPADKVTVGTFKTSDGSTFQTLTSEGAKLLTNDLKSAMLNGLPPSVTEPSRKTIEKALTDFQGKKFAFAWGAVGDQVIFAFGKNLDHLKFTTDPATSLLSKPELAQLVPFAEKNLLGLVYSSAGVLAGMMDEQPFTPMLRGIFGAMKENPMFGSLGTLLEGQLADYAPAEAAVFKMDVTAQAAAIWWDRGVHLESFGGAHAKAFDLTKNLQFARLVDQPGVVAAFAYQRSAPFEKVSRNWMEKLFGMTYTAAQELVKAGIAGPQGAQSFAMFEGLVLPTLKKVYDADRELSEKGLGGEAAFVIDVNGKMPALPGVPPEAKDMKFPRITTISEVANRAVVAESWKKMSDSVSETIGVFVGGGGGGTRDKDGNAAAAPAPGFVLPDPISSDKNGVTTWFYAFPYFAGDLLPSASINDKLLLLSTSKAGAEAFAGELAKPASTDVNGAVWKLDPFALVDWGISAAKLAPTQTPENQKQMKQVQKWVKPFHAMRGRIFLENSVPRQSFSWEITDLVSFD